MKIPTLQGIIRRRLLVNFRVDPGVIRTSLPAPFRPKLHQGHAIAGLCLIRLEQIRPIGVPAAIGLSSENAAHRIAVEWTTPQGETREGVYVHRRDTNSTLSHFAGGRIFPGEHHLAEFRITDHSGEIDFNMAAPDGAVHIRLHGHDADALPPTSCFTSLAESSRFFENGSLGYSPTQVGKLDGLRLETDHWTVRPLAITHLESSWFADLTRAFPGSAEFDHALVMRDIPHRWHNAERLA